MYRQKLKNHGGFFFFFKLLNSALLQFIKQTVKQTAASRGTLGPDLNPAVGY